MVLDPARLSFNAETDHNARQRYIFETEILIQDLGWYNTLRNMSETKKIFHYHSLTADATT